MTVSYAPPTRKRYRVWPIRAVRDPAQPPARGEDEVKALVNVYAQDTEVGPIIVGRPGMTRMESGSVANLGSGSARTGQLVTQFTKRDGTTYTVLIVGGKFYTYNWSTEVATEVLSAANLTSASITLDTSAICYAVTYADGLVVSDGVNVPWSWDGTSGAGLTKLTNCPVLFGPPVVYYAKLAGIKNSARGTFVWSEEGTPNTGYEAGGYNNAWDLVQTSTEGLVALAATDEALYVARANSITAISGKMASDFQTTGTREAVSARIGTRSPAAFRVINNRVWFVDQFGQPRITSGGEPTEIGTGARDLLRSVPGLTYPDIQMVDDPETGHVKFYFAEAGKDYPNFGIWLNREDGSYACKETGYELSRIGEVLDGSGVPTIVHVGGHDPTTVIGTNGGYVYQHGHPNGTLWDDEFHATTRAVHHSVATGHAGHDTHTEKLFLRGELSVVQPTDLTGVSVTLVTPSDSAPPLVLDDINNGGAQYNTGLQYNTGVQYSGASGEQKVTFQCRKRGRWCRVEVTHATLGERFGLSEIAIEAAPISRRPGAM